MPQRKAKSESVEAEKIASLLALDAMMELVQSRRKFFWLNFMAGLWRGVGSVVGAAIAIVLIGYLVTLLGGLPLIGSFIQEIQQSIPAK